MIDTIVERSEEELQIDFEQDVFRHLWTLFQDDEISKLPDDIFGKKNFHLILAGVSYVFVPHTSQQEVAETFNVPQPSVSQVASYIESGRTKSKYKENLAQKNMNFFRLLTSHIGRDAINIDNKVDYIIEA